MNLKIVRYLITIIFLTLANVNLSYSEKINKIEVLGNERVSKEVVIMFSEVSVGSEIDLNDINSILKNIYNSNFFENVEVNFLNQNLVIKVKELPIIETITINGIKAKKLKKVFLIIYYLKKNLLLIRFFEKRYRKYKI